MDAACRVFFVAPMLVVGRFPWQRWQVQRQRPALSCSTQVVAAAVSIAHGLNRPSRVKTALAHFAGMAMRESEFTTGQPKSRCRCVTRLRYRFVSVGMLFDPWSSDRRRCWAAVAITIRGKSLAAYRMHACHPLTALRSAVHADR
jgi:predicted Kef-type K+ transport protein